MKNLQRFLKTIISIAAISSLVACTDMYHRESAGQILDSTSITTQVKTELAKDSKVKARDIKVKTYKNRVQLSGFVDNRYQIRRAEEIARKVPGVIAVENDLKLK